MCKATVLLPTALLACFLLLGDRQQSVCGGGGGVSARRCITINIIIAAHCLFGGVVVVVVSVIPGLQQKGEKKPHNPQELFFSLALPSPPDRRVAARGDGWIERHVAQQLIPGGMLSLRIRVPPARRTAALLPRAR